MVETIDKVALRVVLVSLQHTTDYLKPDGKHIDPGYVNHFKGNPLMASHNALSFKKTTRKDDFISLAYMLIFMV